MVVDLLSIYEIVFKGGDGSENGIDLVIGEVHGEALTIQLQSGRHRFEVTDRIGNVVKGGLIRLRFALAQPAMELTLTARAAKRLGRPAVSAQRIVGVAPDRVAAFAEHAYALLTPAGVSVSSSTDLMLAIAEQEPRAVACPQPAEQIAQNVVFAFVQGDDAAGCTSRLRQLVESNGYVVSTLGSTSFSVTLDRPEASVPLADVVADWYQDNAGHAALEICGTGTDMMKHTVFPAALATTFGSSAVRNSIHESAAYSDGLTPTDWLWETRQIV